MRKFNEFIDNGVDIQHVLVKKANGEKLSMEELIRSWEYHEKINQENKARWLAYSDMMLKKMNGGMSNGD